MKNLLIIISTMMLCQFLFASVKPNSLFSDHMVLQKGVEVPVWGTADDSEKVTVNFNGHSVSTVALNGTWMVKLAPMAYLKTPSPMSISGTNTVIINDILVGEVWLCSGQSNMERQLGPRPPQPLIHNWEKERDNAEYPLIREFYVPLKYSAEKIDDVHSKWTVCSPQTVTDFSAVGYFFARDLYEHLNVPIGIVFSAYGGTPAEDWTSKEALQDNPQLAGFVANYDSIMNANWHPEGQVMSGLYNGMIYPLIPYSIKGVAWYQGENNSTRANQYAVVLENMINNWRRDFMQGDFPFLIVQITPHKDMSPELRDAQLKVSKRVKNAALIVTLDCGSSDIHSPYKQPVGQRLALAAQNLAYGENVEYTGPLYDSNTVDGNIIILQFSHMGKGLMHKGSSELKGFEIAGKDKKFIPAKATIDGERIIVYNFKIQNPAYVRYAWANIPDGDLYNRDGFPASPFTTEE